MAAHNVAAFHGGMQCQLQSMRRAELCPGLCWWMSGLSWRMLLLPSPSSSYSLPAGVATKTAGEIPSSSELTKDPHHMVKAKGLKQPALSVAWFAPRPRALTRNPKGAEHIHCC